ncbi:MAG: hypothetical protein U1E73_13875 [Planctomycetota bacterium]
MRARTLEELLDLTTRLDARYHLVQGEPVKDKERTVLSLARVLGASGVDYAVIGGLAVQFRSSDPRTTLDVDVAVRDYGDVPTAALEAAGFRMLQRHAHSENWIGPDGTPVQFTDDPELHAAITEAEVRPLQDTSLRITTAFQLVRAKLRAARDPSRRRSKRLIDLADAIALADRDTAVRARLTPEESAQLDATP